MKYGVVIFPGSNSDQDLIHVLRDITGGEVVELWHKDTDLQGCDFIFLPGGFAHGDYLRSGAIARLSPIMESVIIHAKSGGFVMGICNGFQILCEAGLLPGALLRNDKQLFICKNAWLKPQHNNNLVTRDLDPNGVYKIPVAHGEGRYYCDEETLEELKRNNQILFRYCDENGNESLEFNPNGSVDNIAGICNKEGNVVGMMPHPERGAAAVLFNTDGRAFFTAMREAATISK